MRAMFWLGLLQWEHLLPLLPSCKHTPPTNAYPATNDRDLLITGYNGSWLVEIARIRANKTRKLPVGW